MKRLLILLFSVVVCLGCQTAGPAFNPWPTAAPRRIPPPATGSIGPAVVTPPYYQPATSPSATITNNVGSIALPPAGVTVPPTARLSVSGPTTEITPTAPSATPTVPSPVPGQTVTVDERTTIDGWRPPQNIIQRAGVQMSTESNNSRDSGNAEKGSSTETAPANHSVLVQVPIRIVEPSSAQQAASVVIQPMRASGTAVAVSEPRRLDLPKKLTEITDLPVILQSVAAATNRLQSVPTSNALRSTDDSTPRGTQQWRSAAAQIRRAP